jgi:protocatechuate 3,4-dioxygenase beta subunit
MEENLTRRSLLALFGAIGTGFIASACASNNQASLGDASSGGSSSNGDSSGGMGSGNSDCHIIPEETAGPYPDKIGMLANPDYFRSDITEGKSGLPLALTLTISNTNSACAPLANADVEIWHCDADGNYSEYTQPGYDGTGETFLRGVQTTDANGEVTFTTIYPGWYQGRVTHIHFQVYVSGKLVKTSQLAFEDETTTAIYKTGVYATKGQNSITTASDMVFSDDDEYQIASLTGNTTSGYKATLAVGVAV